MKDLDLIKNDDAVSVVVGAILILAVLVTFMSVVTSSWVPIYEGDAESDHSDEMLDSFLDLRKQIENADEFPRIFSINLGTNNMPFIKNTNSVGCLELNQSAGTMALKSVIYSSVTGSDIGDNLIINDVNRDENSPIQNFTFHFFLTNNSTDFIIKLASIPPEKLEIEIEDGTSGNDIGIAIEYKGNPVERWENNSIPDATNGIIYNSTLPVSWSVDMLSSDILLELKNAGSNSVLINGTTYNDTNKIAPLNLLIQHYLKLSPDGYDFTYKKDDGISDGTQTLLYNTTMGTLGGTRPQLNLTTIGSGVFTMKSDYNFMVDQSYIYDNGAVILKQKDGEVFKVAPPIFYDKDNITGDLKISFQTVILTGDYIVSGNGLETINVVSTTSAYKASGLTEEIVIMKTTTPELYKMWLSYFSDLMDFVNNDTNGDCFNISNENINQVGVKINNSTSILLTVQTKKIKIT